MYDYYYYLQECYSLILDLCHYSIIFVQISSLLQGLQTELEQLRSDLSNSGLTSGERHRREALVEAMSSKEKQLRVLFSQVVQKTIKMETRSLCRKHDFRKTSCRKRECQKIKLSKILNVKRLNVEKSKFRKMQL